MSKRSIRFEHCSLRWKGRCLSSHTIALSQTTDKYEIVTAKPAISDVFHNL
jgi:hypothetical protein